MNLQQSITSVYSKYATFTGRASRSEFWWYQLFNVVIIGIPITFVSEALESAWSLANLVPSLAVTWRRLHDIDKSGWWQIAPLAGLPFFILTMVLRGTGIAVYSGEMVSSPMFWAGVLTAVGMTILLIRWWATPGTPGSNRFGDDPLNRTDADIFS